MSETSSGGGFSSASEYCRSWLKAASRSARRPLYSQAKQCRFQTSAHAVAAGILPSAPLEAVRFADWIGLGRRRLAQQPAQVDEVFLRCRVLLQRGGPPLRDERVRRHGQVLVNKPDFANWAPRSL